MKFMLQYPDLHGSDGDLLDAGPVTEIAMAAERHGWSGLSFTEHPAPGAKWLAAGGHQTLDPFIALAAAGAVTSHITLLTYLSVLPYRNPLMLAKTAASLDRISNGRFVLGAGTGYLKSEFHAVGASFDDRNTAFDEALDVLPLHWSGDTFSYTGSHFTVRDVMARPRPIRNPIPIWIGGNATRTLQRVAERAQGWMPLISSPELANTTRTPLVESLDAVAEKLAMLRELAGDRFETLDVVVPHYDAAFATTADRQRQADFFGRAAEIGVTWIVVPAPWAVHPATLEFAEGFSSLFNQPNSSTVN